MGKASVCRRECVRHGKCAQRVVGGCWAIGSNRCCPFRRTILELAHLSNSVSRVVMVLVLVLILVWRLLVTYKRLMKPYPGIDASDHISHSILGPRRLQSRVVASMPTISTWCFACYVLVGGVQAVDTYDPTMRGRYRESPTF